MEIDFINELNLLIAVVGYKNLNTAIQCKMKAEFDYLRSVFEPPKEIKEIPEKVKEIPEDIKEVPKDTKKTSKKAKKTKEVNDSKNETKNDIVTPEKPSNQFKNPKEMKIWQREQEEIKRKENKDKNIDPKSLLTIENLKKWLIDEKRTYSYIAREYVGCKDSEVSAMAKAFNIQTKKPFVYHPKK